MDRLKPGVSRDELPQLFVDMGFKIGAEIGVYKGEYSAKFCAVGLKMFCIDPWMAFYGQGRTQQSQVRQNFLYEHAKRVLEPYKNTCTIIRKKSMDALYNFMDRGLDFVYIDGNHNFREVAADIYEWTNKVRIGGVVAGHDYWSTNPKAQNVVCHVRPVIDAYVKAFGIKKLWTFGRDDLPNEKALSWMFVRE